MAASSAPGTGYFIVSALLEAVKSCGAMVVAQVEKARWKLRLRRLEFQSVSESSNLGSGPIIVSRDLGNRILAKSMKDMKRVE